MLYKYNYFKIFKKKNRFRKVPSFKCKICLTKRWHIMVPLLQFEDKLTF